MQIILKFLIQWAHNQITLNINLMKRLCWSYHCKWFQNYLLSKFQ